MLRLLNDCEIAINLMHLQRPPMCSLFLCGAGANGEHWQDLFREFRKGKKKPVTGLRITGFGRQRPERHCGECGFTAA
ncbi:hypothetical protein [Delftia acidovorans]|uniref:hypothetical protein n=1 Tax=Delftia acidovorans TaxID=80866 RepID=UPI00241C1F78|nr:hypothetical protein [Delftia acidovorans]MCP4016273.1 hypothetical protein [Delftia sp.]MCP4515325.1 hypothetical protein [Delftia sp.]